MHDEALSLTPIASTLTGAKYHFSKPIEMGIRMGIEGLWLPSLWLLGAKAVRQLATRR